ncbi:MAG TPA: LD-carboxypeptidase [Polyangiales bacterium]|nr:LD-carboxypeptidase [Polyangiales bacterium]
MSETFSGRYLAPGARVSVVAPAGPFAVEDFEHGIARLRSRYDVHYQPDVVERAGYLAGDDARRLAELQRALDDDGVDAIIAARGGYGATRLLSRLDFAPLRRRPKLLVGFSDISALHAQWARARLLSVHGTMVAALGRCEQQLYERHRAALEGQFVERFSGLTTIATGRAEGVLLGGNLTVLSALLGTPYALPTAGAILFFEDIGERPYRLDRMLTQWHDAGAFAAVSGIVLGAFVQADPGPDQVGAAEVLAERLGDLGIPVLSGLPAGHIDDNAELAFGRRVLLDGARGELQLSPLP